MCFQFIYFSGVTFEEKIVTIPTTFLILANVEFYFARKRKK